MTERIRMPSRSKELTLYTVPVGTWRSAKTQVPRTASWKCPLCHGFRNGPEHRKCRAETWK
jgi:hypothetical protein